MNIRVLALACLAFVAGGCKTEEADASTTKVLMIGNSFSISCMNHLPQVAKDRGADLDIASLYIGGCSLQRHWENVLKDSDPAIKPYRFDRNVRGKKTVEGAKINVVAALKLAKWDVITIQQASHFSWKPESYHPYGDNLIAKIRELQPQAKILFQETWSYTPFDKRLAKWGITPDEMYAKLKDATAAFAGQYGLDVIPMGAAVQEWRRRLPVTYTDHSFGNDVVGGRHADPRDHFKRDVAGRWVPNCDVFHLGDSGEFFQALVWGAKLLKLDLTDLDYRPTCVSEADSKLMREIVADIVK